MSAGILMAGLAGLALAVAMIRYKRANTARGLGLGALAAPLAWRLARPLLMKAAKWLRDRWAAELAGVGTDHSTALMASRTDKTDWLRRVEPVLVAGLLLAGAGCAGLKQGYVWVYDQVAGVEQGGGNGENGPFGCAHGEQNGQNGQNGGEPEPAYDLTLRVTHLNGRSVGFEWAPRAYGWPVKLVGVECDAVVEMRRADGRGGKFDWIRKGGQPVKGLENIHDGYGVWSTIGLPTAGERVTFRWVSVDGRKRSNDAEAVWP